MEAPTSSYKGSNLYNREHLFSLAPPCHPGFSGCNQMEATNSCVQEPTWTSEDYSLPEHLPTTLEYQKNNEYIDNFSDKSILTFLSLFCKSDLFCYSALRFLFLCYSTLCSISLCTSASFPTSHPLLYSSLLLPSFPPQNSSSDAVCFLFFYTHRHNVSTSQLLGKNDDNCPANRNANWSTTTVRSWVCFTNGFVTESVKCVWKNNNPPITFKPYPHRWIIFIILAF